MSLKKQIQDQRSAIAQFEKALAIVNQLTPDGYIQAPSQPLEFLQAQLKAAAGEAERVRLLDVAEKALVASSATLATLEEQYAELQSVAAEKAVRVEQIKPKFRQAFSSFLEVAKEYRAAALDAGAAALQAEQTDLFTSAKLAKLEQDLSQWERSYWG